ncbi:MAG: ATP-binding protein, partial [Acidobacteriota bacterium]
MSNPNQNPNSPNRQQAPEKRVFVETSAVFNGTSLLIGCVGPSSCGKTFSAIALARGIQRVSGGPITIIDTEAGRSQHYAPRFQFKLPDGRDGLRHISFSPPFSPL